MNTLELKGSIYELVSKVNDVQLLEELYFLIQEFIQQKKSSGDWWDSLTDSEQSELEEAIKASYDENNWVTNEEARETIHQWLNK